MRKSNIELLRIVAMMMIVLLHLLIKGADTCGYTRPYLMSDGISGGGINSLIISGVDIFILISGYFGCRNALYNIVRLVLDMAIYGAICFFFAIAFGGETSLRLVLSSMWIFSNWFVVHFIVLLLLSPMIEKALKHVMSRELGYWIIMLAIVNVVLGFVYTNINSNGYHAMNFILLYLIGRYLRISKSSKIVMLLSRHTLPVLAASWAITYSLFLVAYVWFKIDVAATKLWGYNNPFVILTAVSIFMVFMKIDIKSKSINKVATLTFPVFLLHTGVAIQPIRNAFFHNVYIDYGYVGIIVSALLVFLVCAIVAYPVEILKAKPYAFIKQFLTKKYSI